MTNACSHCLRPNLKVQTSISILEESNILLEPARAQHLNVCSHKSQSRWVVLDLSGKTIAVEGDDLMKAIQNALNH
jgi:hypothetical protein